MGPGERSISFFVVDMKKTCQVEEVEVQKGLEDVMMMIPLFGLVGNDSGRRVSFFSP